MDNSTRSEAVSKRSDLYGGLGYFWDSVFKDDDLVSGLARGSDVINAELYRRFELESKVTGVESVPAFDTIGWTFVTLRSDEANTGDDLKAKVSASTVLGSQDSGLTPEIGGYLPVSGYVGYPMAAVTGSGSVIVDNIEKPKHVLVNGVDFITRNNTVLFKADKDPFNGGFQTRMVDGTNGSYQEIALWVNHIQRDKNLPDRFAGYIFGIAGNSSEWYVRYIDALSDFASSSGAASYLERYVYAAADVPYTMSDEVVEYVGALEAGQGVVTDKAVYLLNDLEDANVEVGDTLDAGTPITDIVKFTDFSGITASDQILINIPKHKDRGFSGISVAFVDSEITYAGTDSNGNAKLRFDVYGKPQDIVNFWNSLDAFCEVSNISQEEYLSDYLYDIRPDTQDAVWGRIVPAEFITDEYYRSGTRYVIVDYDRLSEYGKEGLHRLLECNRYMPPGSELVVATRTSVDDELDTSKSTDSAESFTLSTVSDVVYPATDSVEFVLLPICRGIDQ